MDYESRKIKWYWMILFLAYVSGVVWLLFKNNPLLYSKSELKASLEVGAASHLQTLPAHPVNVTKITPPTYQPEYNVQRTSQDPQSGPRSKNDLEYQHFPVNFGIPGFSVSHLTYDNSGFYATGEDPWVASVDLEGKVRWRYHFHERMADLSPEARLGDRPLPVLLDETSAYLMNPAGELVCLDKTSGKLRWLLNLRTNLVADPFIWKRFLAAPIKEGNLVKLVFVDRSNGSVLESRPTLPVKPGFVVSEAPELNAVIFTADNKVSVLDPEDDWGEEWSQTVTDPIRGPAVVVGTQLYVTTAGAKLIRLDGAKRGKLEWEADLVKPAAGPAVYVPLINRMAVMDVSGAISAVETKTGKVSWRGGSENRTGLKKIWSARLSGAHIEEFHMDWLHKGWTIWAPCADQAFCIYTPGKGELVTKIPLSGKPLSLPLPYERRWIFLGETKEGKYVLSHIVEEKEIKRLHKSGL